jgi:hypothetical protein
MGFTLWMSLIEDCLMVGNKKKVKDAKQKMINIFDCDVIGNMEEYIRWKLEQNWKET